MPFRSLLHEFAGGTTMHGIPKAIRARSTAVRVFWSVVCLCAGTMFCVQFAQLLTKYYSYPKKVTIEIVPAEVPFPAISLCNMRNLDTIVLNKLNNIFINFSTEVPPDKWRTIAQNQNQSHPFIEHYLDLVSKYFLMYKNETLDIKIFQTVLTRTLLATNIPRDIVANAGIPFKEFVVTCRFGGYDCNRTSDFSQFFDSYYYNCFTYKAPQPTGDNYTLAEGLENGWTTLVLTGSGMLEQNQDLRIIPGTHERFSPMASSAGIRVVIHPPNTEPFPHTEGFDVPPGFSVSFGVKANLNKRIGPPHGNCSKTVAFGTDGAEPFRVITCQKKCLQREIIKLCGCKDITLPDTHLYPDTRHCTDDYNLDPSCRKGLSLKCRNQLLELYNRIDCVRITTARLTRNATFQRDCYCFPPCEEVSYDVTYSLSKWPAENFDGEEAYLEIMDTEEYPKRFMGPADEEKFRWYREYFDPSNRRKCMRDFARLNVYIKDSNVLKTEESEDYSQSQLLSDIGGQLGLWVGISIITIAEVLELVCDTFKFCFLKYGPYSRGKSFSKPRNYTMSVQLNASTCANCHHNSHRVNMANGTIPLPVAESCVDSAHVV